MRQEYLLIDRATGTTLATMPDGYYIDAKNAADEIEKSEDVSIRIVGVGN